jgi:conjugative relaxase-like TrwC/TraI family protein
VLTIGKLGTTRGRLEYYDAQVAVGVEDYYAGRGESPGRWRGRGARGLGLRLGGRVERGDFMALMRGRHPVDGSVLREMGQRSTVSGFDLTWSAPKSVSVLFAIDDEHVAGQLLAAHEQAIDQALAYMEREACWTRRGRDGVERLAGDGFIAASYRHRMSRAGDPQLHTRVVVANMTHSDGRHTALDARSIYEHKSAAGAVYRAVLRAEVRERLPWLSWRSGGRGLFELAGIPDPVLRHFSQRRVEIEQRAAELVGVAAADGLSRERMQGIALATRKTKRYGVNGASWREEARARAAEHGLGETELAALRNLPRRDARAIDPGMLAGQLSGPEGLTARHNTFVRRHALAEIAGAFAQGASLRELDGATSDYLAHDTVVPLRLVRDGELPYTTVELMECERAIVYGVQRRSTEQTGILSPGNR